MFGPAAPSEQDRHITKREQEIILGIANGLSTKQIASSLGISVSTAERHREHVMKKLDVHSAAGLVRFAVRSGLIKP